MATMNFSIPPDVKETFNRFFAHRNKSAVIAALMMEAIDREKRLRAHNKAMDSLARLHAGEEMDDEPDDEDESSEFVPRGPSKFYP
jgi:hypothetical protein